MSAMPIKKTVTKTVNATCGTRLCSSVRMVVMSYILFSLVSAISLCVILSSISSLSSSITNGSNRFDDLEAGSFWRMRSK
jgi:hypothetical protein